MSLTKEMWMDAVEQAVEDYACGDETFEDAAKRLMRLGLGKPEAWDMLNEAMK